MGIDTILNRICSVKRTFEQRLKKVRERALLVSGEEETTGRNSPNLNVTLWVTPRRPEWQEPWEEKKSARGGDRCRRRPYRVSCETFLNVIDFNKVRQLEDFEKRNKTS